MAYQHNAGDVVAAGQGNLKREMVVMGDSHPAVLGGFERDQREGVAGRGRPFDHDIRFARYGDRRPFKPEPPGGDFIAADQNARFFFQKNEHIVCERSH